MKSIKPGRGPSMMNGIGSLAVAAFGVIWIIAAVSMGAPIFIPLFGVIFVIIAIANAVYSMHNATAKNRMSVADITEDGEEPDLLNVKFGEETEKEKETEAAENAEGNAFCPFCGAAVREEYEFCRKCGKQLPD